MYYLNGYMSIGIVVLLFAIRQKHNLRNLILHFSKVAEEIMNPVRTSWHDRLLHNIVIPAITALVFVCIWPIAIRIFFESPREWVLDEDKELPDPFGKYDLHDEDWFPEPLYFAIGRGNLVQQTSLQDIEASERIFDPLGAAPNVPFGHLNASWQQFIANLKPGDVIWLFSAPWQQSWGQREIRHGYAIVRDTTIPHLYITRYGND